MILLLALPLVILVARPLLPSLNNYVQTTCTNIISPVSSLNSHSQSFLDTSHIKLQHITQETLRCMLAHCAMLYGRYFSDSWMPLKEEKVMSTDKHSSRIGIGIVARDRNAWIELSKSPVNATRHCSSRQVQRSLDSDGYKHFFPSHIVLLFSR